MPDNLTPQPWWAAVFGGLLFTVRWLVGVGASSAKETIKTQKQVLERLTKRVEKLEETEAEKDKIIEELRRQNTMLREALTKSGIEIPAG